MKKALSLLLTLTLLFTLTAASAAGTNPSSMTDAALTEAKESGEFDGAPGQPGADGISPTITVTDITGGHRITITSTAIPMTIMM